MELLDNDNTNNFILTRLFSTLHTCHCTSEFHGLKHHKHITTQHCVTGYFYIRETHQVGELAYKLFSCSLPLKKELFKLSSMGQVNAFLSAGNTIAISVSTAPPVETANTAKRLHFF